MLRSGATFAVNFEVFTPQGSEADWVELALVDDPEGLRGTTRVATNRGVAQFDGLVIDGDGRNVRFEARIFHRLEGPVVDVLVSTIVSVPVDVVWPRRHVVLFVGDGFGTKQQQAFEQFMARPMAFADWFKLDATTYDLSTQRTWNGVGYDPVRFWAEPEYPTRYTTASATAMFTGQKTEIGRVGMTASTGEALTSIAEVAGERGLAIGAVTTVPINHATSAAFLTHDHSRNELHHIAEQILFDFAGKPTIVDPMGQIGARFQADVLIGGGHPGWAQDRYIRLETLALLGVVSQQLDGQVLVERQAGEAGMPLLMAAATLPSTTRLIGLFGGADGNVEFAGPDGTGRNQENPTLTEMTRSALTVLERDEDGFVLLVEGGAIDWAGHQGRLDRMVGEVLGFEEAVQEVVKWIDRPGPPR